MPLPIESIPYYPGDIQDYRLTLPTPGTTLLDTDLYQPTLRLVRGYSASANTSKRKEAMARITEFCVKEPNYRFLQEFVGTQVAVLSERPNPDREKLASYEQVLDHVETFYGVPGNFRVRILLQDHRTKDKEFEAAKETFRREFTNFFVVGENNILLLESVIGDGPRPDYERGLKMFGSHELAALYENFINDGYLQSEVTRQMVEGELQLFEDNIANGRLTLQAADTIYKVALLESIDALPSEFGIKVIYERTAKKSQPVTGRARRVEDYKAEHRAFQDWIIHRDEMVATQVVALGIASKENPVKTNLFIVRGTGHIYLRRLLPFNLTPVTDLAESSEDHFASNYPHFRKRIALQAVEERGEEPSSSEWMDAFLEYKQYGDYP